MRTTRSSNIALLSKLVWRLVSEEGSLWADVVKGKYFVDKSNIQMPKDRLEASYTWRGIVHGANLLRRGCRCNVHDGRAARFWEDFWIMDNTSLDSIDRSIPDNLKQLKVRYF